MSKTTIFYNDTAPGAAENAEFSSSDAAEFSQLDLLREATEGRVQDTCEYNEWLLDGSVDLFDGEGIPFWSDELSGEDCAFAVPPVLEVDFTEQFASLGITLVFDSGPGTWCTDVNIKWYRKDELLADADFTPDKQTAFCQQPVVGYDRIIITLRKTNLPYRYAKLRQIIFGTYRIFDMTEMRSVRVVNQLHGIAAELPVSTLAWTLDSDDELGFMFQFKQPMEVRNDNLVIGVYYIKDHTRKSRRLYDLQCQDILGVLDGDTFAGGIYTDYSAKQLILDIVGRDAEVDFTDVEDRTLTGLLTPSTKRSAIQQVLFAWGVCAATDGGSVIRVFNLDTTPETIGRDRTYTGVTVKSSAIVTAVRVTAHTYTPAENGSIEVNGVKYADTTEIYTVNNPNVTANTIPNVKEVKSATLISPDIGQAVAQRVYDYYSMRDRAEAKIVWRGELLGDCVTVPSAWDTTFTGNLEKMEYVVSNTVAVTVEVPD